MPSEHDNDNTTTEPPPPPPPPPPLPPQKQKSQTRKKVFRLEQAALQQERKPPASNESITEPHSHDVICDRGKKANSHSGNKHYHLLIGERKRAYVLHGTNSAQEIVDEIKKLDPPGRFLRQSGDVWYEVDAKVALEKARQCLSEGAPQLRQILLPPREDTLSKNQKLFSSKSLPGGHNSSSHEVHVHTNIGTGRPPLHSTKEVPSGSSLSRSPMSMDLTSDGNWPHRKVLNERKTATCYELTALPDKSGPNGIGEGETDVEFSSEIKDEEHRSIRRKTEHEPNMSLFPSRIYEQLYAIPLPSSSCSVHLSQASTSTGRPSQHSAQDDPIDSSLSRRRMSIDLASDGDGPCHNASHTTSGATRCSSTARPEGSGPDGICEGEVNVDFSSAIDEKAHPIIGRNRQYDQSLFPSLGSAQETNPLASSSRSLALSEVGRQSSDGSSNVSSWLMHLTNEPPMSSGSFVRWLSDSTRSEISNISEDLRCLDLLGP